MVVDESYCLKLGLLYDDYGGGINGTPSVVLHMSAFCAVDNE